MTDDPNERRRSEALKDSRLTVQERIKRRLQYGKKTGTEEDLHAPVEDPLNPFLQNLLSKKTKDEPPQR